MEPDRHDISVVLAYNRLCPGEKTMTSPPSVEQGKKAGVKSLASAFGKSLFSQSAYERLRQLTHHLTISTASPS